jgi:hypothetical protein
MLSNPKVRVTVCGLFDRPPPPCLMASQACGTCTQIVAAVADAVYVPTTCPSCLVNTFYSYIYITVKCADILNPVVLSLFLFHFPPLSLSPSSGWIQHAAQGMDAIKRTHHLASDSPLSYTHTLHPTRTLTLGRDAIKQTLEKIDPAWQTNPIWKAVFTVLYHSTPPPSPLPTHTLTHAHTHAHTHIHTHSHTFTHTHSRNPRPRCLGDQPIFLDGVCCPQPAFEQRTIFISWII